MVLSASVNRSRNIDAGKRLRLKTINREAGSVFTVIQLGAQGFCAALWIGAAADLNRFNSSWFDSRCDGCGRAACRRSQLAMPWQRQGGAVGRCPRQRRGRGIFGLLVRRYSETGPCLPNASFPALT